MTAYAWKTNVSAQWATAGDWSPSGPPNASTADATIAASGVYTVTIGAGDSYLVNSLTFDPASATLTVNGTLTLGGTLAAMTESSGTVNIYGTIAGGTLAVTGGVLDDTGPGVITSAVDIYGGGTVAVASGKTLTLSGPVTLNSGAQIDGPGTLSTTGSTGIVATPYLDGSLVWDNSGTVRVSASRRHPDSGQRKTRVDLRARVALDTYLRHDPDKIMVGKSAIMKPLKSPSNRL